MTKIEIEIPNLKLKNAITKSEIIYFSLHAPASTIMDKKYTSFTIVEKIKLIKEFKESKMSKSAFCKSKGIPRSTWLGILKHEDKLLNDNNNQTSKKRKRDGKYAELEEARKNYFS